MNAGQPKHNVLQGAIFALSLFPPFAPQAAGLLQPSDASLPPLQIRDHLVDVVIEDGYAIIRVEQVFHNPHNQDLEGR